VATGHVGMWGIPINIFALAWCIFFVAILPFPSVMPVTLESMNYAGPITLAIFAILSVDWIVRARHEYYGPRVEIVLDEVPVAIEGTHVEKK
jgi:choline transport protein